MLVPCPKSGYLQQIDHVSLVSAARAPDALIVLGFRPGQFHGPSSTRSGSSQDRRHPRLPDPIRSAVCKAFLRLGHWPGVGTHFLRLQFLPGDFLRRGGFERQYPPFEDAPIF